MTTRKRKKRILIGKMLIIILLVTAIIYYKGVMPISGDLPEVLSSSKLSIENSGKNMPRIKSKQGILLNLETGEVIASKKPDERAYPASVTKMMSAYVITKRLTYLDQLVEIPAATYNSLFEVGASMAGFYANEQVPANELLYGLMLPSGAEATVALATHVAGSEAAFVDMMNQTAKELGMSATNFTNSTGLHDPDQYTTVTDMATLLTTALKEPAFREVFTTKERVVVTDYHPEGLVLESRVFSKLDSSKFNNGELLGGKTGYTDQAGQCLASLATVNGTEYIAVTFGAKGNHETDIYHIEDAISIYQSIKKS